MKQYKKLDQISVRGRGEIILVEIPPTDSLPVNAEIVLIDDKKYKIRGVEATVHLVDPPVRNKHVGLLVHEVRDAVA